MLLTRQKFMDVVHYIPGSGLVYLNNPKAACSSVKQSLWSSWFQKKITLDPHDRHVSPFCKTISEIKASGAERFLDSVSFTVVRNPYVRILSAYLDKIASEERDTQVWHPFARRHRLSATTRLTFSEFLTLVLKDDPHVVDPHFSTQTVNTLAYLKMPNFVGHLEQIPKTSAFLEQFGVTLLSSNPHRTDSINKLNQHFNEGDYTRVKDYYKDDFVNFGYSTNPAELLPLKQKKDPKRPSGKPSPFNYIFHALASDHSFGVTHCLNALKQISPSLDTMFVALETKAYDLSLLAALGGKAIRGEIDNWGMVVKIAQELASNDYIHESAAVMYQARLMRHGE